MDLVGSMLGGPPIKPANVDKIVINELLCYTVFNMQKYPVASIKTTLLKFYSEFEISIAKKLLFTEEAAQICGECTNRQGANKKFRELEDIMDVLKVVDTKQWWKCIPTYVAKDITRLPKNITEEECMTSILARISNIEQELNDVKSLSHRNNNDISSLKSAPVNNLVDLPKPRTDNRYSSAASMSIPSRFNARPVMSLSRLNSINSMTDSPKRQRVEDDSADEDMNTDPSKGKWSEIAKRNNRRKPQVGVREDCNTLVGGQQRIDIFVSHVQKGTGKDALKVFLETEDVTVIAIEEISHAESRLDSFKVTVDKKYHDKLCGENAPVFWPSRILCRMYIKKRIVNVNNNNGGVFNR